MFKLPKKVKEKWVKALRSGKYKQGQNCLWNGGRGDAAEYCCLGVAKAIKLCKKSKANGFDEETKKFIFSSEDYPNYFVSSRFLAPELQSKLANMNDEGSNFEDIATWIEKNL